jgi:Polyketide cyclase / dehydrase and lipid transport
MANTSVSIDLPASADHVWQLIGGFDSLPDWLPLIPKSELSEGGRLRHLTTGDGQVIVERLESFDQMARSYSYSLVDSPFPVKDYVSTIRVEEASGKSGSRVTWAGSFEPVGISDDDAVRLFHGIYEEGLQALKETLATGG